jgi:hypothetical protein
MTREEEKIKFPTGFPPKKENGQYFFIKSLLSEDLNEDLVLDLTYEKKIIAYPKKEKDNDNQLWYFENGFLFNKQNDKNKEENQLVMDVSGGNIESEAEIIQYNRKPSKAYNQRFGYRDGFIYCLADPRFVLDVKGDGKEKEKNIILYRRKEDEDKNKNQKWNIEEFK